MSGRAGLRLAVVAGAALLVWLLQPITVPLFAAYLLMLALLPLQRRLRRRIGNAAAAFVCTLVTLALPVLLLLPTGRDLGNLTAWIAGADVESLRVWLSAAYENLIERLPPDFLQRLSEFGLSEEQLLARAGSAAESMVELGGWVSGFFGGLIGIVSFLVLLPVFLYYLLEGAPWPARLRGEIPHAWHARYDRILPRIEDILCSFTRTRLLIGVIKGLIAWAVLTIAGFPGAYTLALLLGLFSILPVVGPLAAWIAVASVGLVDGGHTGGGLGGLLFASALSAGLELLEGYVLLPKMIGRGLGLSDFAVVLAMLAGGILFGFLGGLVAVPLVAVGKVFYAEYLRPVMREREESGPKS